jgi:hypothetical protein
MASELIEAPQTTGERIRYVRDFRRGMKGTDVVNAMRAFGITIDGSTLTKIERDKVAPTPWQAIGFVAVLGATPEELGLTLEDYPQLALLTKAEVLDLLRDIRCYLDSGAPPAEMSVA